MFVLQENREKQTELNQRDQSSSEMADLDNIGVTVELHVYDLTKGLAASLSQMLIGKPIVESQFLFLTDLISGKHLEGVWHTGIVAYGREYFFGAGGVQSVRPVSICFSLSLIFNPAADGKMLGKVGVVLIVNQTRSSPLI